jgi:hypothetical protein
MRHTLNSGIQWLIIAALALPLSMAVQNAPKPEKPAKTVSGEGCVEAGVEAGCLVLKDGSTLYNLFFTGKKPSLRMAIRFSGAIHEGPTTCMQGTPVDVKEWTQTKTYCPPATDSKKPAPPK